MAFWLGCWTAWVAATLDTVIRIQQIASERMVLEYQKAGVQRAEAGADARHFDEALKAKS